MLILLALLIFGLWLAVKVFKAIGRVFSLFYYGTYLR